MSRTLTLDAVEKFYAPRGRPPVHAVKALSMEIKAGETVALLGSSGCGKTSTLRMIAGFESVSDGEIRLGERRIDALPPARRNVAMAFEGYSLYPPLTVRENVGFALKAARTAREEAARRVERVADLLEISDILDRHPRALSGGQQQRVSLARALVRDADLHLLDEPMSQLEPQLRAVLRGRIKNLIAETGMTALFVTHDQTEANALADRIAVMEDGVLQHFASPDELKDRPANLFVATFIGEPPMNVFPARVEEGRRLLGEDGLVLDYSEANLPPAMRATLGGRETVTVGVRPHKVRLGTGAGRARVASRQWLGDQTHVALEAAGRLLVAVSFDKVPAAPGEEISFALSPEDLHLFDSETGAALVHGGSAA